MKKILKIISSPAGAHSFSNKLAEDVTNKIIAKYPGSQVQTLDLTKVHYPHLEESHLNSWFAAADQYSPEQRAAVRHSDEAIDQFLHADIIVIGTPMYNFGIPSNLKAWVDHIVRVGKTFMFKEDGTPQGLVEGKKVYLAISSGSVYSEGPFQTYDFIAPYFKAIFGFIGVYDVSVFRVEGTNIPPMREHAMERGASSVVID
jgi:FMN-dependent NADH-azoreductase